MDKEIGFDLVQYRHLTGDGRYADAIQLLRKARNKGLSRIIFFCGVGACLYKLGRPRSAERWLRKALLLEPKHLSSRFNLANALTDIEKFDEAIYHYDFLVRKDPDNTIFFLNYCHALGKAECLDLARIKFAQAERLVFDDLNLSLELARLLVNSKLGREVKSFLTRLTRRYTQSAEAFYLHALCLRNESRYEEAIMLARKAFSISPDSMAYACFLAEACLQTSRPEDAIAYFERILSMGSSAVSNILSHGLAYPVIPGSSKDLHTYWARALASLRSMVQNPPEQRTTPYMIGSHLFFMAYHWQNLRTPMTLYSDLLTTLYGLRSTSNVSVEREALNAFSSPTDRSYKKPVIPSSGRIRLGFASEYFREHSNSRAFEGLISNLDKRHFDIIIIHGPKGHDDETKRRISAMADTSINLRDVNGCHPNQHQIHELDLDILFYTDLGMNAQMNYLAMQRLAPIQMTGWGIPHTSGIRNIDYYISSDLAEPDDAQNHYVETLVRLPGLPCCYPSSKLELHDVPREYFILPPEAPIFGCLQSLFKLHPQFDFALESLALSNPDAAFVLVESPRPSFTQRFVERIQRSAPHFHEQLIFLAHMHRYEFMALSNVIDVLLDPFYYCSGITFYESTFVGTPTVTLEGKFLRSRFVAAAYKLMGITKPPVAHSVDEYVEIATRLMQNPSQRALLREELKHKAKQHLYDDLSYVRGFEEFCKQAVVRHGLRPASAFQ